MGAVGDWMHEKAFETVGAVYFWRLAKPHIKRYAPKLGYAGFRGALSSAMLPIALTYVGGYAAATAIGAQKGGLSVSEAQQHYRDYLSDALMPWNYNITKRNILTAYMLLKETGYLPAAKNIDMTVRSTVKRGARMFYSHLSRQRRTII